MSATTRTDAGQPNADQTNAALPTSSRARQLWAGQDAVKVGVVIIVVLCAAALLSLVWTPYPPLAKAVGPFNEGPSADHWFGTDATGSDVFSRALAATRIDLGITALVVSISLVVGTLWGGISGFVGSWFDAVSMRVLQVMNAFPALLLAMLVITALGGSLRDLILVVVLIPLPDYMRLARAEVLTKKHWQFAEAAAMIGRRPAGVLFRHLLPNSTRPLIAYAGINASWVIATIGSLGYLGLGIEPGSAEWGSMIAGGQSGVVDGQWWTSFFPGVGIFLVAAAFHLFGDGLTDHDLVRRGS